MSEGMSRSDQQELISSHAEQRTWSKIVWRSGMRNSSFKIGGILVLLVIATAVLAPWIAPYDPLDVESARRLESPSSRHWFGTDNFGRDVLSRVIYGGRLSLRLGLVSVGIGTIIGGGMGLISGYHGGWTDTIIQRFVDMLFAFPGILLAMIVVFVLGPGLFNLMVAVGIGQVPRFARIVRGSVLSVREMVYIESSRASGAKDQRILLRHVLPNILAPIIIVGTLGLAQAIISAAALSFLGFGAEPPTPEWGVMLSTGRARLLTAWWMTTFPGLAIMITVLSFNVFGDGLRDALDPKDIN